MREKLIEIVREIRRTTTAWHTAEDIADKLIANGVTIQRWIPVTERLPENFISVLGYMPDAVPFPPVRECYTVGNEFYFPALHEVHMVTHWMPLPEPPKEEEK